jgi:hypothetical protein
MEGVVLVHDGFLLLFDFSSKRKRLGYASRMSFGGKAAWLVGLFLLSFWQLMALAHGDQKGIGKGSLPFLFLWILLFSVLYLF